MAIRCCIEGCENHTVAIDRLCLEHAAKVWHWADAKLREELAA